MTLRVAIMGAGAIARDQAEAQLDIWNDIPGWRARPVRGNAAQNGTLALIKAFIRDILEDRGPLYGPQAGWATVATIDAAYRAGNRPARSGRSA